MSWELPQASRVWHRLTSFGRIMTFDKRGTGLSDPITDDRLPGLEQRMDDMRAVMDAVGSWRSVLIGGSEGAMMCMLFAATYPERVQSLILYGAMARATWSEDHPWNTAGGSHPELGGVYRAVQGAGGRNRDIHPEHRHQTGRARMVGALRAVLREPAKRECSLPDVPRSRRARHCVVDPRSHADSAPDARLRRQCALGPMARRAHPWGAADRAAGYRSCPVLAIDALVDEMQEFITGTRERAEPDRVLKTVMLNIAGSTERAAELGDAAWRDLLATHDLTMRRELERFRGQEIKTLGDGFLAAFDGPARDPLWRQRGARDVSCRLSDSGRYTHWGMRARGR